MTILNVALPCVAALAAFLFAAGGIPRPRPIPIRVRARR